MFESKQQLNQKVSKAKENIIALLQQENNKSITSIIKSLKNEIKAARKTGKTWGQIQGALDDAGIKVSLPTIAKAFSQQKNANKKADTAEKKKEKNAVKSVFTQPQTQQKAPLRPGYFEIKPDRDEL